MTNEQAKQLLQLYRPGTADAVDPDFAEALELCEHEPELKKWFGDHCALYAALRSKFKQIAVPEGLKEQIIAERQVHTTPLWQRAVLVTGAVAAIFMAVFSLTDFGRSHPAHDFATYQTEMGQFAKTGYGMDLNTNDIDQIRLFLAQKSAIADYVVPGNLQANAKAAGCAVTSWQGKSVSMICFQSGRPLAAGAQSDLWLFISEQTVAKDAPAGSTPVFHKANGLVTASWTIRNRTYVLATEGDEQFLGKYLPEKAGS
jgi:hypothetical protein